MTKFYYQRLTMTPYSFIKYNRLLAVLAILAQSMMLGCAESEYSKLVRSEMAKNTIYDELVFDMKFGYTKKQFFDRCWELNNQKLVDQGPNNKFVQHILKSKDSSDGKSVSMLFYGSFNNQNIMTGMDMEFSYVAWAPWNKDLYAQKLVPALKDTLQKWYPGNGFIPLKIKELDQDALVKVDGNRQITIYTKNTKDVVVKITDLKEKYPRELK